MSVFQEAIVSITDRITQDKLKIVDELIAESMAAGYVVEEVDLNKPWGAYIRFSDQDADNFVSEFFPGLSSKEARMGVEGAGLSPKFLIVSPQQRLSLQTHDRRSERWKFLTKGNYYKSSTDQPGDEMHANAGEVVQFQRRETHRLCGKEDGFVVVAEIWQHSDPENLSDEDDILRLADDYQR